MGIRAPTMDKSTSTAGTPYRRSSYVMRLVLGGAGLLYFFQAGAVTRFVPLRVDAVLALIGIYMLANLAMMVWDHATRADTGTTTVMLDLVLLLVIVLQDPYPASPVTILLLSTVLDYGRRLSPWMFSGVTAMALGILAFNVYARLQSSRFGLPPEGLWLSAVVGVLMLNFHLRALSAAATRLERQQMAQELEELRKREREELVSRLRTARVGEGLRFTGAPREEYAQQVLTYLAREMAACCAALYEPSQVGGATSLVPLAAYAVDLSRLHQPIALDEGLVGACARQKRMIELHQVPEGYFDVTSGLGRGSPQHLYLLPLQVHAQLVGVVELATTVPLPAADLQLLLRVLEGVAVNLLIAAHTATKTDGAGRRLVY